MKGMWVKTITRLELVQSRSMGINQYTAVGRNGLRKECMSARCQTLVRTEGSNILIYSNSFNRTKPS